MAFRQFFIIPCFNISEIFHECFSIFRIYRDSQPSKIEYFSSGCEDDFLNYNAFPIFAAPKCYFKAHFT